jgi:hypothetical protein
VFLAGDTLVVREGVCALINRHSICATDGITGQPGPGRGQVADLAASGALAAPVSARAPAMAKAIPMITS